MAMKSLKLDAEEAKREGGVTEVGDDTPDYPWGMRLCLDSMTLDKLGITELPVAGAKVQIVAVATVTEVELRQRSEGEDRRGVDLQITDMELSMPKGGGSKMYDNGED